MNQNESGSSAESEKTALELYKTAFARLNFQDEYLFKFSAVFLTAQGALAALVGSPIFRANPPNYPALFTVSVIGLLLAVVWSLWIRHNDYWHSVWTGTLREIEEKHLRTPARVFDQVHSEVAKKGGRSRPWLNGHWIAQLVPMGVALLWAVSVWAVWSSWK